MTGYTKLFGSILESTVWLETPPIKVVWITMLAMADRDGVVEASVPGLAKRAGVERGHCEQALAIFLAPDPDSRTPDFEGRRIEPVAGGWRLLNYEVYRHRASADDAKVKATLRQRRSRERRKALLVTDEALQSQLGVTNNASNDIAPAPAEEEPAERTRTKNARDAEKPKKTNPGQPSPLLDVWLREFTELYPKQARCASHLTETAFCYIVLNEDTRPDIAYAALCTRLAAHKRSDQWQRGKIPRLDRYLREGLHLQELPEPQPASAHAGRRLTEPEPASRFDESQISPWVIECRTLQHEPRCQSSATHALRLVVAETCQHWGVCESLAECKAKGGARTEVVDD